MSLDNPMSSVTKIFCATDLSQPADEAIRQADEWARYYAAALTFFHALPSPLHSHPLLAQSQAGLPALQRAAFDTLSKRVGELSRTERAELSVEVVEEAPYAAIVERAEQIGAGLVVVGSRGASGLVRQLLGGVAERVVRYAHSPVLTARAAPKTGRVLAATDLSDPSLPAIAAAADVVRRSGAQLSVVHCLDLMPIGLSAPPGAPLAYPVLNETQTAEIRRDAEQRLNAAMAGAGVSGEALVVEGAAVSSVLRVAEELEAELLVVGCRGRSGLSRVVLGSVAEALVRLAPCPVLAVRLHSEA